MHGQRCLSTSDPCESALQAGPISDTEIEDLVVSLHDIEVPTICCYIPSTCATLSRQV
jgi:hypothetical protein